jgi:hypothetical protein
MLLFRPRSPDNSLPTEYSRSYSMPLRWPGLAPPSIRPQLASFFLRWLQIAETRLLSLATACEGHAPQLDEKFLCPAERIRSRFPDPRFPLDLALLFCFTENSLGAPSHIIHLRVALSCFSPGMILLPPALRAPVADEGSCGACLSTLQAIAQASSNPRHPKYIRTSRIRRTNAAKQIFQKLYP